MKSMNSSIVKLGMTVCFSLLCLSANAEQKGQDFPGTKCTCKGCETTPTGGKKDVTGQCEKVCKDKTVYSKGSEPYDYCKAARVKRPIGDRSVTPAPPKEARP